MKSIGIVGIAGIGTERLKALRAIESVRVDWLSTRNAELLASRAKEFGVANTATNWRDMLADDKLDAVCICTPNNLHAAMAIEAMRAGKHVLLEYPLAVSIEEIDTLLETVEQAGMLLHLGLTTRHEPQQLAVRKLLPELGGIVEVHGTLAWPTVWKWTADRDVVGSFFALANFHFADHVVDWFGKPDWVSASVWEKRVEGKLGAISGSMFFGYQNGASGHINYTMALPAQKSFLNFELICTGGRITWHDGTLTHHRLGGSEETVEVGKDNSVLLDTAFFVDQLLGKRPPDSPDMLAATTRLCLLAEQSARSGNVKMPL